MARVKCPRCFHVNPDGNDQCEKCRTPLPRIQIEAKVAAPATPQGNTVLFKQGQLVANRYTVMNIIGRGGMGCIYKVHDRILGEEVALKTLLPQLVQDKLVVERFFNEARIARRLSHPHIVRVHDIGVAGDTIYISMEFIRGHSLRGLLEQCGPNQRLPLGRVLVVFEELCAALEYAHQFTVHRDIKPENVMIDEHGRVKLMDFGISKLMADTRMTGASVVMGTPFYMAPEQFRNSRDVDARADIYSVGVMLYEILTGVMPSGVPKPASEMRSGMPPGLDAIVLKCVDPDPNKRYASAAEVREALVPLRTMVVNGTMPKAPRDRSHSFALPAKRIAGVLLALAALVLAGAGAYYANTVVPEQAEAAVPNGMGTASLEGQSLYDSYASLKSRVRTTADERGGAGMADVLATGDDLWARAETTYESGQLDQAALLAQEAFTHFMAAIIQPGGMVFVPPGDTWLDGERVTVGGFLMDETEVSVLDFRNFTQNVEGGWPFPAVMAESPDNFAMAAVTYYDAQAFAANHGKQLPSVAQWARAAYAAEARAYPWGSEWLAENCDCLNGQESEGTPEQIGQFEADRSVFGVRDMAGGVSEWTSTAQAGQQAAEQLPTFGTQMLIRGGNFNAAEVPLTQSFNWLYEERAPIIGFRCVKSIPSTPVAVKQVLDQS